MDHSGETRGTSRSFCGVHVHARVRFLQNYVIPEHPVSFVRLRNQTRPISMQSRANSSKFFPSLVSKSSIQISEYRVFRYLDLTLVLKCLCTQVFRYSNTIIKCHICYIRCYPNIFEYSDVVILENIILISFYGSNRMYVSVLV